MVNDVDSGARWESLADRANVTNLHLLPAGQSQIDSITFSGSVISGTATFIDTVAFDKAWQTHSTYPAGVPGSFEIRCPSVAP